MKCDFRAGGEYCAWIFKTNSMRKIERNRMYMIQAVGKIAKTYNEVWMDYPEFVELFATLNAYEEQFQSLSQQKQLLLQPFSGIKQDLRDDFALTVGKLAAYLVRIARQQNDRAMLVATRFTVAQFKTFSAQKSLVTAENVIAFAEQYKEMLESIPTGGELLQKTKEQLQIFVDKGLIPAERRTKLGETTVAIRRLSREVMDFLKNELDLMMRVFVDAHPEFHLAYENARIIPKYGGLRGPSSGSSDPLQGNEGDGASDEENGGIEEAAA